MAVWVIRGGSARGLHEQEFLDEHSIGVYFGADIDLAGSTREEIEADVREFYLRELDRPGKATSPPRIKGVITRFTNQLLLFRDSIQEGDTVLMPRKRTGGRQVAVGRIVSGYEDWAECLYRHRRRVAWEHESVPRESLPYTWRANDQQTVIWVG